MPRAAAAKQAPAKKPTPKGAYASRATSEYVEAKNYVSTQMPVILGLLMKTRRLTFEEVSEKMGLSAAAVRHRVYGRTEFSAGEMVGLARALGIDPRAFYDPSFDVGQLLRP